MPSAASRRCQLVGISLLAVLTSPIVNRGQSSRMCDEGKPFTAQMVEHIVHIQPDGTERKVNAGGLWARDSGGLTYAELFFDTKAAAPKTKIERPLEGVSTLGGKGPALHSMVDISNCHTGEDIKIFLDLKNFRVEPNSFHDSWMRKPGASLYQWMTRGQHENRTIEDLGFKEMEGVVTHGYRETVTGRESEGEWSGIPIWTMESWVSEDLMEAIQTTISDFKNKTTMTTILTGIKRDEPPETLFEIPSGFTAQRPTDKMSLGPSEPKAPN